MAIDQVRLVEKENRSIVLESVVRLYQACQARGITYGDYEQLVASWMELSLDSEELTINERVMANRRLFELGCPPLEKCPRCTLMLPPGVGQMKHMVDHHPDIVEKRRSEAARWNGWEDD